MRARVLLPLVLALGCARSEGPALFELEGIHSAEVEVGEALVLEGRGFPTGRPPHVHLKGAVERLGAASRRVDVVAPARVTSSSQLEVPIAREVEEAFFGDVASPHGTFRGTVEVGFAAFRADEPPVTEELRRVRFEVSRPMDLPTERGLEEDGKSALVRFGLVATSSGPSEEGASVVVSEVFPGGLADRRGVVVGDRVVSRGDLSVHDMADLAGASEDATLTLRQGDENLELTPPTTPGAPERSKIYLALLAAVTLAFLAPEKLFRPIEARSRRARLPALSAILVAGATTALIASSALAKVEIVGFALAVAAIFATVRLAGRNVRSLATDALLIGTLFAFASRASSTLRFAEILAYQGREGMLLLASPVAPFVAFAALVALGRGAGPSYRPVLDGLVAALVASLFVAPPLVGPALGAALFAAATFALVLRENFAPAPGWVAILGSVAAGVSFVVHAELRSSTTMVAWALGVYVGALVVRMIAARLLGFRARHSQPAFV